MLPSRCLLEDSAALLSPPRHRPETRDRRTPGAVCLFEFFLVISAERRRYGSGAVGDRVQLSMTAWPA